MYLNNFDVIRSRALCKSCEDLHKEMVEHEVVVALKKSHSLVKNHLSLTQQPKKS